MDLHSPREVCISSDHSPSQNNCDKPPVFTITFPTPLPTTTTSPTDLTTTAPPTDSTTTTPPPNSTTYTPPSDTATPSIITTPSIISKPPPPPSPTINGALIGGVIGGIFGLLLLLVILGIVYYYCYYKKKGSGKNKVGSSCPTCVTCLMHPVHLEGDKADGQNGKLTSDFEQRQTSNGNPPIDEPGFESKTESTKL